MRNSIWLLGAVLLTACGPAGVLSGKVTVEGGSAAGIAVIVYGPQSGATVTGEDGAFTIGSLPDGKYVVRATVRNADVEEVNATTTITNGKAEPEPILAFRSSTAKVTGRVVMADGSGAEELTVTATGPETRGVRTTAGGAFVFEGLKTGAYVISVEGKDTREGRVAVGVNASGAIDAGELRLTPVGRIGGLVTFNAMPVAGAPVIITGTNTSAVTDAMGRYQLVDVPTGMQGVLVRVGTEPFFRSATAMVTVVRGANPDVDLTLTDDAPRTGTVAGVVTFHGPRSPRDITVSAPGTGITATPQVNGAYTMALPVGVWDVVANAPQHPPLLLGRVTVIEGGTQSLPGAEVSWYRPIWRSTPSISQPQVVTSSAALNDNVPWSLVQFSDSFNRLALVNSTTYDFRILAVGNTQGHRISKNGKYAAWYVNQTAFVYEIGTANLQTFTTLVSPVNPVVRVEFSSDESAVFIQRSTPANLTRIKFASANMPETFPTMGAATAIQLSSVDRWFVRDTSNSVRLVTPAIDVPNVFTNVSAMATTPTAYALTNCGATCEFWILGPTSTSVALRVMAVNPAPTSLYNFSDLGMDNRGDYPCFSIYNGLAFTSSFCVNSMTAAQIPLTAHPSVNFRLNEAGDRVVWSFNVGATFFAREEPMPPTVTTTNLASGPQAWSVGWISPTRAYAFDANSGSPRTLHLIKAGMVTTDSDITGSMVNTFIRPPLIIFPQLSSTGWRAYLGDGAVRTIPVATGIPVVNFSVRGLSSGPNALTRYAAVSFDQTSAYIIDETAGAVRYTTAGQAGGAGLRSGSVEWFDMVRFGGGRAYYVYSTNAILENNEQSVSQTNQPIGAPGVSSYLGLSEDQRTIVAAGFLP
ncbi:MAG: carboxypeptidase regulatory-like domain-containing protein [Archangium sp.]|nr:carboxypeptidase regulatory-like domain-containing protein [Archangium sp.]MDP3151062.1 carboxypeptidase regulatory-like domain-containing protein [Archangium sp.]MDP3571746.1 carboxypeptidase regulatory-like domain-containing protein [Archangium sp.]